jgi:hypothetical protein
VLWIPAFGSSPQLQNDFKECRDFVGEGFIPSGKVSSIKQYRFESNINGNRQVVVAPAGGDPTPTDRTLLPMQISLAAYLRSDGDEPRHYSGIEGLTYKALLYLN